MQPEISKNNSSLPIVMDLQELNSRYHLLLHSKLTRGTCADIRPTEMILIEETFPETTRGQLTQWSLASILVQKIST